MTVATTIPRLPEPDNGTKDPGIIMSLIWIVGLVGFQVGGIALAYIFHLIVGGPDSPMLRSEATLMFGILIGTMLMIATRANYLCRHTREAWDKNSQNAITLKNVGWTFAVVFSSALFAYLYQIVFIGDQVMQPEVAIFLNAMNQGIEGTVMVFLVGAIGAPVLEEILFRGQLQGAITNKIYGKMANSHLVAIAITAMIFALIHFQPLAIPPLFVAGCAFGWVRWKTGSLVLPIAAHMMLNAFSLTVLLVTGTL